VDNRKWLALMRVLDVDTAITPSAGIPQGACSMLHRSGGQHDRQDNPRRFVVLDRDGTIIVDRPHLSDPDGVELLPGAAQGLRQLQEMGLGLIVITNQSGIGRGFFTWEHLDLIHKRLCELLKTQEVYLDGIYVCPHKPDDHCRCRKPEVDLLELAARKLGFDPWDCFVIGDKTSDIELGRRVGATTFLIRMSYGPQVVSNDFNIPDYVGVDLCEAARVIRSLLNAGKSKAGS
jgi:D-glycero-D-manno-heptose 1,7-bisphosphate phosphatase